MAGYNRGIVATRKLNEKNKARLKASGDTELGFIKGRLSHINKDEKRQLTAADAYDISLRERVESDIAEKGAGTINPYTGMPEYHWKASFSHMQNHAEEQWNEKVKPIGQMSLPDATGYIASGGMIDYSDQGVGTLANFASFDEGITPGTALGGQTKSEREAAAAGTEAGKLSTAIGEFGMVGDVMGQEEFRDILSDFDVTSEEMKYLTKFETKPFEFMREEAGLERGQVGSAFGAGYQQAGAAQQQAIGQSGFQSSGTIAADYGRQMKGLTQDYQTGMTSTQLGLEKGLYGERARQRERLFDEISAIPG